MRSFISVSCAFLSLSAAFSSAVRAAPDPASVVPATAPRTNLLAGRTAAFRAYVTAGEGAKAFTLIQRDLDRDYATYTVPAEPLTYGDPSPSKRDSAKADKWRAVQDLGGRASAVAEAAALCWIVTGEEKYEHRVRRRVHRLLRPLARTRRHARPPRRHPRPRRHPHHPAPRRPNRPPLRHRHRARSKIMRLTSTCAPPHATRLLSFRDSRLAFG